MQDSDAEVKLLASVLFELRAYLASYLGEANDGPIEVRIAAHMAYAVHNQAINVLDGRPFDVRKTLESLRHIDTILNITDMASFTKRAQTQIDGNPE